MSPVLVSLGWNVRDDPEYFKGLISERAELQAWRCHDSCIPASRPCWLSWLKVSGGLGDQQLFNTIWVRIPGELCHCRGFDLSGFFKMTCEFSFIPSRCLRMKVSIKLYPVSCRSRWKWMHSCVTKDGKKHLTVAQWHGFAMVFYCEGMSLLLHSITLEALLERSPPSSAHLESRFLGSVPTSDKALMVTCQTRESLQ